ncbi:DUF938 domain-containing protein [Caenimonas sp. SL110]|uniref:DUF938 domain-containing protein n=1 Tax=Caenimonas sp. SL110 TaxID=1450524 RepID=UPI000653B18B|nr:DUF938 domain-containing protein [Caenimonas sp. SL110]
MTLHSPAADRNKQPIADSLVALLPASGNALEIASGTGQHAAWFASRLPGWVWQPSDMDSSGFDSITADAREANVTNVRAPVLLDVTAPAWPSQGQEFNSTFDAIFCANMLHISPWMTCAGLMQGAARYLAPGGVLITYGPYIEDEVVTSPGNIAFDQSLRERNPAWGIRHIQNVKSEAERVGLMLRSRQAMPANNLLLVFARR